MGKVIKCSNLIAALAWMSIDISIKIPNYMKGTKDWIQE